MTITFIMTVEFPSWPPVDYQAPSEWITFRKTNYIDTGKILSVNVIEDSKTKTKIYTTIFADESSLQEWKNESIVISHTQSRNSFYEDNNIFKIVQEL